MFGVESLMEFIKALVEHSIFIIHHLVEPSFQQHFSEFSKNGNNF